MKRVKAGKIPLNRQGKIDREQLVDLHANQAGTPQKKAITPPRSDEERILVQLWGELLGLAQVDIHDNFFEIGGDSIKAIQVISRLGSFDLKSEIRHLFESPTIAGFARHLGQASDVVEQTQVIGALPLTPIQHWLFADFPGPVHHMNQAVLLDADERLDVLCLNQALQQLIQHHDALRMVYTQSGQGWTQENRSATAFQLEQINLAEAEHPAEALQDACNRLQAGFDLAKGPLVKAAVLHLEQNDKLLIVVHHLVVDGISWRILFEDLSMAYQSLLQGTQIDLPLKTAAFKAWAEALQTYSQSATLAAENDYWQQVLETPMPALPEQTGHTSTSRYADSKTLSISFSIEETNNLLSGIHHAYNTQINDVLLSGLARTLASWHGGQATRIFLESHGRDMAGVDLDITRTVGWFTAMYPVVLPLASEAEDIGFQLQTIKESLRNIPNQGYGYGLLRYLRQALTDKEPSPRVTFNYLGQFDSDLSGTPFRFAAEQSGDPVSPDSQLPHDLSFYGITREQQLTLYINFDPQRFAPDTLQNLLGEYRQALLAIVDHCKARKVREITPSDLSWSGLNLQSWQTLLRQANTNAAEIQDVYPLSPLQSGMLYEHLYDRDSQNNFLQVTFRIQGDFDTNLFTRAWNELFQRHDTLRTRFWHQSEQPLQLVYRQREVPVKIEDWRSLSQQEQQQRLNQLRQQDRSRTFDISNGETLMRFTLVQLDQHSFEVVWSFHHIVMDGWCFGIVYREFLSLYQNLVAGTLSELAPAKSYASYIQWLAQQDEDAAETYWKNYLADFVSQTGIPKLASANLLDEPAEAEQAHAYHTFEFATDLTAQLNQLAAQHQVTLYTVLRALWALLLAKYNDTSDVVFGMTVAGRPENIDGIENMLGLFINTLPSRIQVDDELTLAQLLQQVHVDGIRSKPYHHHPLHRIQAVTDLRQNLFDHIVVFENYPMGTTLTQRNEQFPYFYVEHSEVFEQISYDFGLFITPGEQIEFLLEFNPHCFPDSVIQGIERHLRKLADDFVSMQQAPLRDFSLLDSAEREQILVHWNATRHDDPAWQQQCTHHLFEAQVQRTPDAIALIAGEAQLSYQVLNARANQVAHYLIAQGVTTESLVGVFMQRTQELLVVLLGIFKSGAAYVPLDPNYPEQRVSYILKHSGTKLIVTNSGVLEQAQELSEQAECSLLCLDRDIELLEQQPQSNPVVSVTPDNRAYLLYTSGSTGAPKGVDVSHRVQTNAIGWSQRLHTKQELAGMLASTSICFDMSLYELYLPLSCGGTVILADHALDLPNLPHADQVTTMNTVPSAAKELLNQGNIPASVQTILLAGEPLPTSLVNRLYREVGSIQQIYDAYGPSESYYTSYALRQPDTRAHIGKPISNLTVYILDRHREPVPVGVPGEIYIGGAGLARGYFNAPELTAEKFIANPFPPAPQVPDSERLYQTGDSARFLPDGNIEFLGRIDHQVKLRGFRVELGEIEAVMARFPGVMDGVAMVQEYADNQQLIAYVVMRDGVPTEPDASTLANELRTFLGRYLPDYMLPVRFMWLHELPMTPNGKLDRKRLPKPERIQQGTGIAEAPRTAMEEKLAQIWTEVLAVRNPGIHDQFFELGGDSIKAIQVIARLAGHGVKCEMRHFIQHPSIAELAAFLDDSQVVEPADEATANVVQELVSGPVPITPIQHWFFQDVHGPRQHFNNAVMLQAASRLNLGVLKAAFDDLLHHHDALRLTYSQITGDDVQQYNQPQMDFTLDNVTLDSVDAAQIEKYADQAHASFDLANGPLIKAVRFQLPDADRLLIVVHHLIIDGLSWRILFADLMTAYQQRLAQQTVKLPLKTAAFKSWSESLQTIANSGQLHSEAAYWRALLTKSDHLLPLKDSASPSLVRNSLTHSVMLSADETHALLAEIHHAYKTRINDILLTGLALTLNEWRDGAKTLLALESHGRDFPAAKLDISRTVGWFTALYPVLLDLGHGNDLGAQIKYMRDHLRAIPNNGVGYGILKYLTNHLHDLPAPAVSFNYLGQFDQDLPTDSLFSFASEPSGQAGSPDGELTYPLFFSGIIKNGCLRLILVFDPDRLATERAEQLLQSYRSNLLTLVEHCKSRSAVDGDTDAEHNDIHQLPPIVDCPEERYEPFPLSDIQQAYWVGRGSSFELGNVSTHTYVELDCKNLDLQGFQHAWQRLIERHEMLRMVILPSGQQQFLRDVPEFRLPVTDLREQPIEQIESTLADIRNTMSHQVMPADRWPLFDLRATLLGAERIILHIGLDALVADALGMRLLSRELLQLYHHPDSQLEPLNLSFRDYILAEQAWQQTPWYQNSFNYWKERIQTLSAAPDLPMVKQPGSLDKPHFQRRASQLQPAQWQALKQRAAQMGLTSSGLLLAAFAEVLGYWSKDARFTLNLTLFNRIPVHPQVNDIVGDFTSLILVEIDTSAAHNFAAHARQVQQQLWQDLEHRHVNGVRVLREVVRQRGNQQAAVMPVVFTSTLTLQNFEQPTSLPPLGETRYGIGQTPQVWLDHQVSEEQGYLKFDWDSIDELFPDGMLDDMFKAYCDLLERLAMPDSDWEQSRGTLLPSWQQLQRNKINQTAVPISDELMHTLFLKQAKCTPTAPAVITPTINLNYQTLAGCALSLAEQLRQAGAQPNTLVAVVMPKGWEQVVAVYGILLAGAAYLPIDPHLPEERQHFLLRQGEVNIALTLPRLQTELNWPDGILQLVVTHDMPVSPIADYQPLQSPDDLAYVIFTSGSTGQPKGVMIDHRGAVNTLLDINQRYHVQASDRVLGISALNFDLSVYDIFGLLAAGGALVLPDAEHENDPAHWLDLLNQHQITLWNSVPALLQIMADYLLERPSLTYTSSLRLCLLSGDWIPLNLPEKIWRLWPDINLNSLGGATEASIWSIQYPIRTLDAGWNSVPYGKPMLNQQFHVLDSQMQPCPVWVPGALYIGGIGLAKGYWRDEERTQESFITHPQTGEPLYRTGDMGRYLPDGEIEFLGREDFQVKIHGYRIELGEIETALQQHPRIRDAVVTVVERQQLAAYLVLQPENLADYQQNDDDAEGLIRDDVARLEFKLGQPGLRTDTSQTQINLPQPIFDEALTQAYLTRQSYRQFKQTPLPLNDLSQLLASLSQMQLDATPLPKYRYPSAGNLYPVQTYIAVKPGRISGLDGGVYYYHPAEHRLDLISAGEGMESKAYGENGSFNQGIYTQSAFGLFLIGKLDAIRPLYGEVARDFCLLEAGYMSQLLMEQAPHHQIGLCPIGGLDFASQAERFQLASDQLLLHSFLGGAIEAQQTREWVQPEHQQKQSQAGPLREYLQRKLPSYMIPAHFIELEQLPLTTNGKVDRQALPLPENEVAQTPAQATAYSAPQTALEQQLATLWEDILALPKIGREDDFFALGGDSLLAIRMMTRLRENLNLDLSLRELYAAPQLKQLAVSIATNMGASHTEPSGDDDDYIIDEI